MSKSTYRVRFERFGPINKSHDIVQQSQPANDDWGIALALADVANAWYEINGESPVVVLASALRALDNIHGSHPNEDNPAEVALFKAIEEYCVNTDELGWPTTPAEPTP